MNPERKCLVENCNKLAGTQKTRCYMHIERFKKYKSYDLPEKPILPDGIVKICPLHGELSVDKVTYHVNGHPYCRQCKRKYRAENKDKVKIYNENTRLRRQEWVKKDRKENPERYKEYAKQQYSINGELWNDKKICRKYKITLEQYKKMISDCENKCEICRKSETKKGMKTEKIQRLSVDHDHLTGRIRGLLCHDCNTAIGKFKDSVDILEKAVNYLKIR